MATPVLAFPFAEIADLAELTEQDLEALTHESIAVRAHELWQERGCPEGSPEVDWLAAEDELLNDCFINPTTNKL